MDNQIYRAPSIPKINRTTIASPFTRGGGVSSGIRLRRSTFSFIRPIKKQIDPENLAQPVTEQTNFIGKELAETNRVLVEIQKQLSLDFAYRIAEEKKAIALEKKRISARKVSDKEFRLEKGSKGILGKTFDAVTAPFKSIFQKLIDFFSIILTGILMNTAFEWLGKKENQAKVKAFFEFVTEYWKELLIIFAAYKLLKLVKAIAGVANTLRRMLKWFKAFSAPKGPKPPGTTPTSPSPWWQRNTPSLSRANDSYSRFIQGSSNFGDRLRLLNRGQIGFSQLFTKGGPESLKGTVKSTTSFLNGLKVSPGGLLRGGASFGLGLGLDLLGKYAIKKVTDPLSDKTLKDTISRIKGYDDKKYKDTIKKINELIKKEKDYQSSPTHSIDKFISITGGTGLTQSEQKTDFALSVLKGLGEVPKYSQGGTVGQGDRAGTDTVPAQSGFGKMFLDAGEEVIRTSSAMLFRPLLKDINENAGRMWQQFTQAVIKLMDITGIQKDNAEIFKQVLENYNKFLKEQIQKMKLKELENVGGGMGGGDGRMSSSRSSSPTPMTPSAPNINLNVNKEGDSPQVNLSPTVINASISAPQSPSAKLTPVTPIVNNFILDSSSNKPKVNVMSLPPIMAPTPPPKVPTYAGKSNEVPNIVPFDLLNPWMTKESISERYGVAYGI